MPFDVRERDEPNPAMGQAMEMAVASAAMITPGFWEACLDLPAPDDFDQPGIAALWEAIEGARREGRLTKTAVVRQLRDMGWTEADCFGALKTVDHRFLPLVEAVEAVRFLLDRRVRRRAAVVLAETQTELNTSADPRGVLARHERAMADVTAQADGGDAWIGIGAVTKDAVERVETGFEDLDRVTGGLPIGAITIVSGRTGMGKTAFATGTMRNVAHGGDGVGYYSLEMEGSELRSRMACDEAWERQPFYTDGGSQRTDNPFYSQADRNAWPHRDQEKAYLRAGERLAKLPIAIDATKGRTVTQIILGARRLKATFARQGKQLKVLIVDHLGLVKPDARGQSRHLDLADMVADLLAAAGELKIAMVLLHQLNRDVEKRPDKRPLISDLRESGSLEEIAHQIILLYRPAYYDDLATDRGEEVDQAQAAERRFTLELHVAKNRGGPRRRVDAFCEIGANAIRDMKQHPKDLGTQGGLL